MNNKQKAHMKEVLEEMFDKWMEDTICEGINCLECPFNEKECINLSTSLFIMIEKLKIKTCPRRSPIRRWRV